MRSSQAFKMALKALGANKMRSFLTMLGIIIGVFAVSMLISLGQGVSNQVSDTISGMGSNLLSVSVNSKHKTYLDLDTLYALEGTNGIKAIAPYTGRNLSVKNGTTKKTVSIDGVTPSYAQVRNQGASSGRFILDSDLQTRSAVAVIGVQVARDLFGETDVVGQTVSIEGRDFRIVGVLEEKGANDVMGQDNRVIVPFTTAQRMLKQTAINSFYVSSTSEATVNEAQTYLERFLGARARDDDAVSVFSQGSILDAMNTITGLMTTLLGGLAGISLLVGGIGIMNIMLVSVTERTREIGIRKAIGAQRGDILTQFLIEAVCLSMLGGAIGLGLGAIGIQIMGVVMDSPMSLTLSVALLAFGFSMIVGIGFGLYPAAKASKLKPIDALRYE